MGAHLHYRQLPLIPPPASSARTRTTSGSSSESTSTSTSNRATSSLNTTTTTSSTTPIVSTTSSTTTSIVSTTSTTSNVAITSSDSSALVHTATVVVQPTPSDLNAPSPPVSPNPSNSSFLQNKVASVAVFTVIGIVGLVVIMLVATFFLRGRRNRRLLEEAVSFSPVVVDYDDKEAGSSVGHGTIGPEVKPPTFGTYYNSVPAPFTAPTGYGHFPGPPLYTVPPMTRRPPA